MATPSKRAFPLLVVLLALGGGFVLCAVVCGVGGYLLYFAAGRAADKARDRVEQEIGIVGVLPDKQPANIDDALAEMRGNDKRRKVIAARWLFQQPVDPARQAEVAKAFEPFLADLGDRDLIVAGVWGLKQWATADSVPVLVQFLGRNNVDNVEDYIGVSIETLGRFPDPKGAVAAARWLPRGAHIEAAHRSLDRMGKVAEPAVLPYMNDPEAERRARALLDGYGTSATAKAKQCVVDLDSPQEPRRHLAVEWLDKDPADPQAQPAVFAALVKFIQGPDAGNRGIACRALDIWSTERDAPALLTMLKSAVGPSQEVRRTRQKAMILLGKFRHEPAIPAICAGLSDQLDRFSANQALESIGPPAKDEVMKYIENADRPTRDAARELLKKIAPADNVELMYALRDIKSDEVPRRIEAAGWFARQKAPIAAVRAEVAQALIKVLDDQFSPQAADAAKALKVWAAAEDVPALIKAVSNVDERVRYSAIEALVRLKDPRAVAPLAQRLAGNHDRPQVAAALKALGPMVELEVVKLLANPNKDVCIETCSILAAIGTKTSLGPLAVTAKQAMQRNQPDIFQAANAATQAIQKR
jgi:HEAT repeat protein